MKTQIGTFFLLSHFTLFATPLGENGKDATGREKGEVSPKESFIDFDRDPFAALHAGVTVDLGDPFAAPQADPFAGEVDAAADSQFDPFAGMDDASSQPQCYASVEKPEASEELPFDPFANQSDPSAQPQADPFADAAAPSAKE